MSTSKLRNERTLVLLKPDAVLRRQVSVEILKSFLELENAKILSFKHVHVPEQVAVSHYKEHEGKSFFPWLVKMITAPSGVIVLIMAGKDVVRRVRALVGPTYVEKAKLEAPASLRAMHGVVRGVNALHASDSVESGMVESKIWMEAFGLKLNEEVAKKEIQDFIREWDGKFPNNSEKIQELASRIRDLANKLKGVLAEETSEPEGNVEVLVKIILGNLP